MKLSLIIPAYNEEERLQPFLASIESYLVKHPEEVLEILLVDDGSTDGTLRMAEKFRNRFGQLRVLRHEHNRGKGAAVQTGVMAAHGDAVVFMDADGATGVSELPKMIQALGKAEVAVGNRWMKGSETERHSHLRRLSGWVYRRYMGLFGLGSVDTMCGFKGYHRAVARDLFKELLDERWLFDAEIIYRAVRRGHRIENFPIRWASRDGSKLSAGTLLASAFRIGPLIHKVRRRE